MVGIPTIVEPTMVDPTDGASFHWTQATVYDGTRHFDGTVNYSSGSAFDETLTG
jgi:hypothetical protein